MTELQRLQRQVGEKRREVRRLALSEDTETEALETAESELTLLERRAERVEGREVRELKGSPPLHREERRGTWTVRSTWTTRCPP